MINLDKKIVDTRIYSVWEGIKARCYNLHNKMYYRYGGRGIKMCDEWKNHPKEFIKWAYQNGYDDQTAKKQCVIDRIDNDKDYCPENCRWVTTKQNNRNKNTKIIEYQGVKKHWLDWCETLGISRKAVEHCVERYHFTYPQAFDRYTKQRFDVKLQTWVNK